MCAGKCGSQSSDGIFFCISILLGKEAVAPCLDRSDVYVDFKNHPKLDLDFNIYFQFIFQINLIVDYNTNVELDFDFNIYSHFNFNINIDFYARTDTNAVLQ
ncbi:hypothetical protein UCRPA7_651 [Phaeoacremonium minimum UCRPA7]|uniref:Uncharacterized protein n=1 Tax=Phaeoacremonium minimum (strain UCR-PA7) TaxID=1286976 RepID=R8BWT6_PHAM7|nr:hypothetical protein UCRPA7_651 [Phaeoacremonium minimum UCRPA7]EOO03764.1 hypothetical protein UCRPA7_651 [Phaeoacremonium minimum UCRPA7]